MDLILYLLLTLKKILYYPIVKTTYHVTYYNMAPAEEPIVFTNLALVNGDITRLIKCFDIYDEYNLYKLIIAPIIIGYSAGWILTRSF